MPLEVGCPPPEPAVGESIAPGTRQGRLWPQGNRFGQEVLGITPNTVMAHMARALTALRSDLVPERQQETHHERQ